MCGIAGQLHYQSQSRVSFDDLYAMSSAITHRGPDDDGFYISTDAVCGLGHRRLSIIDLHAGKQPIHNEDNTKHIVFNGEIYNYKELKEWLIKCGHKFYTNTDTEVILHLYEEEGVECFKHLNGVYAIAIYDETKQTLLLARDVFGVKPLYYSDEDGVISFGSEIKALLANRNQNSELDYGALGTFLTYRFNPAPQTLIAGIRKLKAGTVLIAQCNREPRIQNIEQKSPNTFQHISYDEAEREYRRLLTLAVERQMMSDVPVGLLLSGGIDSAVIGKLMREYSNSPINSYTIGFEGSGDYNELDSARRTSQLLGTNHHELTIGAKEYMDFFARSFYYTEEPIAMTSIPAMYYVSKLASNDVKVVLAGQGADEPLAGYDRYYGESLLSNYSSILKLLPLSTLVKILPRNEKIRRLIHAMQYSSQNARFRGIHTIFTEAEKQALLQPFALRESEEYKDFIIEHILANTQELTDSLSRLLYLDARHSLPDNLLLFNDKMSMANSIELRVPFLDLPLMNFLESLPSSMKLRGRTGKYIHKKAAEKWLPDEIIQRKKLGFSTPMDEWMQGDFSIVIKKLFNEANSGVKEYFNIKALNQIVDEHTSQKANNQRKLFALLSFELWHRTFFQKVLHPKEIHSLLTL
jgi:asparagine synthase (glutamine-hydrolysing)